MLAFFSFSFICNAQSEFRLSFHHLTREDGLSNNNVFYMHRDSRGYLWLASTNGLNRFDGTSCKVYKPNNSAIAGTHIKSIIEDKTGNLWVGSQDGLNFYDRKTDSFMAVKSPSNEKIFSSFPHAIDDNGLLWVVIDGVKKSGLYTYDWRLKKYTFITDRISKHVSNGQNQDFKPIKTIYCGGKNDLGLLRISIANFKVTKIDSFFYGKKPNLRLPIQPAFVNIKEYLLLENDSTLWITGNSLGLVKFNPIKNTFKTFNKFKNTKINLLNKAAGYKNYLLVGAVEGLYVFDKKLEKFTQLIQHSATNHNSLMANWNEVPYVDKSENLFLSQLGFGIDYTNLNRLIAENWLGIDEKMKENHVELIKHRGDETWLKLQNSTETLVLDKHGKLIEKYINKSPIFVDSESRSWLLGDQSFYLIDAKGKVSKKLKFKVLEGQSAWQLSIVETRKNVFIIATSIGLFEYDELKNKLKPIQEFNKEGTTTNSPVFYDNLSKQLFVSSNWWTEFYVLNNDGQEWKIKKKLKFPFLVVAIRPANNPKKIWLGSSKGLVLLDKQSFSYQLFTEKNGLPDNSVTDILEEPNNNHWLVTNSGISYFDNKRKTYRNFTSKDGAYSNEYNWNSCFKLSDGRMVFAGTNGVSIIDQNAIKSYEVKPIIQISELYINEKKFKPQTFMGEAAALELAPSQNSFGLNLIGIEYGFSQKVKLHYILQGYDKQWIEVNNPAVARYTNVAEGTYDFLVKATNEDGNVSSEVKILKIIVHAPFYKTTWFRIVMMVSFLALFYLLYRLRERQIRLETEKKQQFLAEQNEILEKQVGDRTMELQESLERLKITQNQLIQTEKLASLGELTAGIAHEIQNPLNFVNNFSELSLELISELKEEKAKIDSNNSKDESLVEELLIDLEKNQEKINFHGKRASKIVKGMLEHSSIGSSEMEIVDINKLVEENLRLAFHAMKAKNKLLFDENNIEIIKDYDANIPNIKIMVQDISRVLFNIFSNAFYAISVDDRSGKIVNQTDKKPIICISTKHKKGYIEITVKDNGNGIEESIKSKVFQPFFTTKPTGEGIGLGLSIANDIVTKGHNGKLEFESVAKQGTSFIVSLPS